MLVLNSNGKSDHKYNIKYNIYILHIPRSSRIIKIQNWSMVSPQTSKHLGTIPGLKPPRNSPRLHEPGGRKGLCWDPGITQNNVEQISISNSNYYSNYSNVSNHTFWNVVESNIFNHQTIFDPFDHSKDEHGYSNCLVKLITSIGSTFMANLKSQMIHVWNIYLQNWVIYGVNVGKYTIHGSFGNGFQGIECLM